MTGSDKFRVFLEQAPDAFFAHDLQGRITDANLNAAASLGYATQELVGMSVLDIEQDFDLPSAMHLWSGIEPGKTVQIAGTHRRKDGTTFPVEIHATGVMQDGEKTIFALVRDVSARWLAEAQLERQSRIYKALSEVNQAIVRMEDEKALFPTVCRMAVDLGGMKLAWVGQERSSRQLVPVAIHGSGQQALAGTIISTELTSSGTSHPAAVAWQSQKAVTVNALGQEAAPWRSMGAFPILRKGKPHGVLMVYHDEAGAFDDTIVRLLEEMARDVSYALDVFDREASRKRASETIKAQNDFLKAILEAEPECVKVVSPSGKLIHMNPAGLAMLEVDSLREAQQSGFEAFVDPGHMGAFREFHRSVCAGGSGTIEFPMVGKKGAQRWLETHATPLRNARGEVTALLGVTRDITEKKRTNELIWRQANFDQLTELPNRNMFYDLLSHEIKRAERDGAIVCVLFIDLDRFKEVNDTLGHQTGDLLLMEAASRIVSCVRKSDTVARLGGDEFTVILPQLHSTDHVEKIAQVILDRLAEPFQISEVKGQVYISASIGITVYPVDASDIEPLISNADQAMYAAKNSGRNRYSFFTHSLQERAQSRLKLLNDLRRALKKNQLVMHFQPVVDLATGRINKAESLMRWEHPERGMISPAEFIPLAEETGLIMEIGDWAFREASRWASRWENRRPGFKVSVNMSPVQFRDKVSGLGAWLDYMRSLNLSGKNIVIEITESLLLDADSSVNLQLHGFRDAEIEVAIDDFGTGYSSLSYINRFPIDYLKIDQSFVQDLVSGSQHHALSKAIIVMGHELGLKVIAEGIETDGQRDLLRRAGCDFGQGYLFAHPVSPATFESRVFG